MHDIVQHYVSKVQKKEKVRYKNWDSLQKAILHPRHV